MILNEGDYGRSEVVVLCPLSGNMRDIEEVSLCLSLFCCFFSFSFLGLKGCVGVLRGGWVLYEPCSC